MESSTLKRSSPTELSQKFQAYKKKLALSTPQAQSKDFFILCKYIQCLFPYVWTLDIDMSVDFLVIDQKQILQLTVPLKDSQCQFYIRLQYDETKQQITSDYQQYAQLTRMMHFNSLNQEVFDLYFQFISQQLKLNLSSFNLFAQSRPTLWNKGKYEYKNYLVMYDPSYKPSLKELAKDMDQETMDKLQTQTLDSALEFFKANALLVQLNSSLSQTESIIHDTMQDKKTENFKYYLEYFL